MTTPADAPAWLRYALEELANAEARADERIAAVEIHLDRLSAAQERTATQLTAFAASTETRLATIEAELIRHRELLERLAAVQERSEERLVGIERRLDGVEQRLDDHGDQLVAIRQRLDDHGDQLVAINQRLDDHGDQLTAIRQRLDRHGDQLGQLTGRSWESEFRAKAPSYLADVAQRVRVLTLLELDRELDAGVSAGRFSEAEAGEVRRADLVWSGRDPQSGERVFVVVEVSARVATRDVDRAATRAQVAAKLGNPAIPVVAGERIDRDAAARTVVAGVRQVITTDE